MTTEILILVILGLSFLLAVIKTAIREALSNSKPTTVNYGTIVHYEISDAQGKDKMLPDNKTECAAKLLAEAKREILS